MSGAVTDVSPGPGDSSPAGAGQLTGPHRRMFKRRGSSPVWRALNGTVPSHPQYLEAAAAARRVAGVWNLQNHLEVVLPSRPD